MCVTHTQRHETLKDSVEKWVKNIA